MSDVLIADLKPDTLSIFDAVLLLLPCLDTNIIYTAYDDTVLMVSGLPALSGLVLSDCNLCMVHGCELYISPGL